jgi:hypothetical protein
VTANGKHSGPAVATGTLPQGRFLHGAPLAWKTNDSDTCPPGSQCARDAIDRVRAMLSKDYGGKRPSWTAIGMKQGGGE